MALLIVFYKRTQTVASSFEVNQTSRFPGVEDRALTAEDVFALSVSGQTGTAHPFATVERPVSRSIVEGIVTGLNAMYLAFVECQELGMYQILEIMARLPGRVTIAEGASAFFLPGPGQPSLRVSRCSTAQAKEAIMQRLALASASVALKPLGETSAEKVTKAILEEGPHGQSSRTQRPRLLRPVPPTYEDFSAASISAARASFLDLISACQRVIAHVQLLREDVREMTRTAMDIVGIPADEMSPAAAVQEAGPKFYLPCSTLEEFAALDSLADRPLAKAAVSMAIKAATRGCTADNFHKQALHGLVTDELLSVFHISELADCYCPYPSHGRAVFPKNTLKLYMGLAQERCSDLLTPEQKMFFWFSVFAEVEAAYKRQNLRDAAQKLHGQ